jgi:hypothetical protein
MVGNTLKGIADALPIEIAPIAVATRVASVTFLIKGSPALGPTARHIGSMADF